MVAVWRVSAVALCLLTSVLIAMAQDSRIKDWFAVPPHSAGIILSVDFPVFKATISNDKGDVLVSKQWIPKIPLIWHLQVPPDIYQIRFQEGPIWSIGVIAKQPGSLTYVRLARYQGNNGEVGLNATVSQGPVPSQLIGFLEAAEKIGIPDAFSVSTIGAGNRILLVSTEPPWKIPPPPPPPPG
jgi:hypothetical protein